MAYRIPVVLLSLALLLISVKSHAQEREFGVPITILGWAGDDIYYSSIGVSYTPARSNMVYNSSAYVSSSSAVFSPILDPIFDAISENDDRELFDRLDRLELDFLVGYI